MRQAFRVGVARAGVHEVAGDTSPVGLNDPHRTSSLRFARFFRQAKAGRYLDVYSHHPYTPHGSINSAPDQPPNDPSTTVTLSNLRSLLRLFPTKPFYLTEYGYNTQPNPSIGLYVSQATQARYLKAAYRYAARYPQVKLLVWYLGRDARPPGAVADQGVYTGLRRPNGERRPLGTRSEDSSRRAALPQPEPRRLEAQEGALVTKTSARATRNASIPASIASRRRPPPSLGGPTSRCSVPRDALMAALLRPHRQVLVYGRYRHGCRKARWYIRLRAGEGAGGGVVPHPLSCLRTPRHGRES